MKTQPTPTTKNPPLSLAGRTLRFKFIGGPTANKIYEHTFDPDGTVVWRDVTGTSKAPPQAGKKPPATRYASFEVAAGMHLVSYLSESGYTLTVLVNTKDSALHGFASNEREWYPLTGQLQASE